ncbi:unnamed protein product [Hermetia illucens]|uniref:ascorbate ferrireductase (transmembrane) n=1 Tax=Hermetia illucens TaxID=343691 RepID=A0A7R8US36_HERIL|nr:cytochrome b561 domain-containing protein 2-like [Hermetia illucens]CAD7086001.1 unnamed protein product [Hermetia illucens]
MEPDSRSILEKLELLLNTLNHMLIGFVSIYMTWYGLSHNLSSVPLHAWLCTIGYQFLMAEAIMCFYSGNAWTSLLSTRGKRHIHWVLQVLGSGLALAGFIIIVVHVTGEHFTSIHGILGLVSTIFLLINLAMGLAAFFSIKLRNLIKPIISKTLHVFLGLTGFVLGMVTLYYGIIKLKRSVDETFVTMLAVFSLITLVLSSIGTLKTLFRNLVNCCN